MTLLCYALIANGKATLHELQTVYSLEDGFDLLEIMQVQAYYDRLSQPELAD